MAAQYHTARFRLVPRLAKALSVPVPPVRKPGSAWTELPRPAAAGTAPAGHVRIGYARASTVRQSLDTQTGLAEGLGRHQDLRREDLHPRRHPARARQGRRPGPGDPRVRAAVTIVVHEHKRLGRGIELAALAEQLRAAGIGLEFLTGELQGSHDPSGVVFTVLAALSGMEREYIRDRTLEGHESARARGKAIGGAAVTDDAMLAVALHLRGQELSLRDIAARLVISTGKKKGQHPSPATVMRMLREHDEKAAAADVNLIAGQHGEITRRNFADQSQGGGMGRRTRRGLVVLERPVTISLPPAIPYRDWPFRCYFCPEQPGHANEDTLQEGVSRLCAPAGSWPPAQLCRFPSVLGSHVQQLEAQPSGGESPWMEVRRSCRWMRLPSPRCRGPCWAGVMRQLR